MVQNQGPPRKIALLQPVSLQIVMTGSMGLTDSGFAQGGEDSQKHAGKYTTLCKTPWEYWLLNLGAQGDSALPQEEDYPTETGDYQQCYNKS